MYTDGGCRKNPGIGAWATYIELDDHTKYLIGKGLSETTNNQMELTAPIEGLLLLEKLNLTSQPIRIYCDSKYVIDCVTTWIEKWIKNNWRTASKEPVKNKELVQKLHALIQDKNIEFEWVKGHNGIEGNEICDQTANDIMDQIEAGNLDFKIKKSFKT